jgi:hypothetical protein
MAITCSRDFLCHWIGLPQEYLVLHKVFVLDKNSKNCTHSAGDVGAVKVKAMLDKSPPVL